MIPIRDHYESIEEWARALSQSLLSDELTSKDLDQQNILGLIDALAGKVEVAGDTMTGALTLPGDPGADLEAATKQYVDNVVAGGGYLPLTGGVMTGKITLDGNPTVDLHAVPRQYVDAGDTFDDSKHGVRGGGNLHADVVAGGADGFMKGTDKTKLEGIAAGATVDQSDSAIKTAYENNADTNEFSDAEQTKLAGIDDGARDDLTASEILALIKTVDGGGSGLDADLLDAANLDAGAVANTVGKRDGSADFTTRLLRQTYGSANGNGSYFLTQNLIGTSDNYARPMTLANVRAVLGGSGNGLDADKLDSLHAVDFVKKDGSVAMAADLAMGTNKITGVVDPTTNQEAATKKYVDDATTSAGALVLLATASAANDSSIDFTTFSSVYDRFLLIGTDIVPATDGQHASIRISIASAWKSGSGDYAWAFGANFSTGAGNSQSSSSTLMRMLDSIGNATGEGLSFELWLPNPASTSLYKNINGLVSASRGPGNFGIASFGGRYDGGTQAIDGIRFFFESGNVTSGEFALYGVKKT